MLSGGGDEDITFSDERVKALRLIRFQQALGS